MPKRKHTFESALARLEEIVQNLEAGEISLDESIKAFEEGGELVKFCMSKLDAAEKKVKTLSKDDQGNFQLNLLDDESE
jgi:exodeoxyribonuclease VII small subunit